MDVLVLLLLVLILILLLAWLFEPVLAAAADLPPTVYNHYYLEPCERQPPLVSRKQATRKAFPSIFDEATVDLSVIVPAYNEEFRLDDMMKETMRYLTKKENEAAISQPDDSFLSYEAKHRNKFSYEVIIVDDGSTDNTARIAMKFVEAYSAQRVRLLRLYVNQGKGGAVQQGMLHARGRLMLMVDADGATRFGDLDKLLAAHRGCPSAQREFSICVGSRAQQEDDTAASRSPLRKILMMGFHLLVTFLCVQGVKDTQCGFKLFTRKAAMGLFVNQKLRRWSFDVELLFIAQQLGYPIFEVGVNWTEIPGSKVSVLAASIKMARDLLLIRLAYTLKLWRILSPSAFMEKLPYCVVPEERM